MLKQIQVSRVTSLVIDKMYQEPESCPVCSQGPPWSTFPEGHQRSNWSCHESCPVKSECRESFGTRSESLDFPLSYNKELRTINLFIYLFFNQ